jgi:hypothetical protein
VSDGSAIRTLADLFAGELGPRVTFGAMGAAGTGSLAIVGGQRV